MRLLILTLVLGGLPGCAPAERSGTGALRAGAYAMDVTPEKFPVSVNGGMRDRQATGAHDPLHARCLVLDDGRTRLAIAVVDSCMIPRDILDTAKEWASKATGIPTENMLISATHTHTAPTVTGVFQSDPDDGYRRFLAEKIAEGIARTPQSPAPYRLAVLVLSGPAFSPPLVPDAQCLIPRFPSCTSQRGSSSAGRRRTPFSPPRAKPIAVIVWSSCTGPSMGRKGLCWSA